MIDAINSLVVNGGYDDYPVEILSAVLLTANECVENTKIYVLTNSPSHCEEFKSTTNVLSTNLLTITIDIVDPNPNLNALTCTIMDKIISGFANWKIFLEMLIL